MIAAVEPGTKRETAPSRAPEEATKLSTPSVRSMTSPSPWVEKRSSPVWTATGGSYGAGADHAPAPPSGAGVEWSVSEVYSLA